MNKNADEAEYVCEYCGADVSIDDVICPKCGGDISEVEEDSDEEVMEETATEPVDVLMPDGKTIKPFVKPKEPIAAMLLSIIPGAWQLYNRDKKKGLLGIISFFAIPIVYLFLFNFLPPILPICAELTLIIWSMADAYKTADDFNSMEYYRYQISLKRLEDHWEKEAIDEDTNTITSAKFVDSMRKLQYLLTSGIYSRKEFNRCKMKYINELNKKQVDDSPNDFLTSIISLSNEGILDKKEIEIIKHKVLPREKREPEKHEASSIGTKYFIETLQKFRNLHESGVFSEDEYKERKLELIDTLSQGALLDKPEDFLTAIIPLVKDKAISEEELKKIKGILLG
jgi:hypothetical protein